MRWSAHVQRRDVHAEEGGGGGDDKMVMIQRQPVWLFLTDTSY